MREPARYQDKTSSCYKEQTQHLDAIQMLMLMILEILMLMILEMLTEGSASRGKCIKPYLYLSSNARACSLSGQNFKLPIRSKLNLQLLHTVHHWTAWPSLSFSLPSLSSLPSPSYASSQHCHHQPRCTGWKLAISLPLTFPLKNVFQERNPGWLLSFI